MFGKKSCFTPKHKIPELLKILFYAENKEFFRYVSTFSVQRIIRENEGKSKPGTPHSATSDVGG